MQSIRCLARAVLVNASVTESTTPSMRCHSLTAAPLSSLANAEIQFTDRRFEALHAAEIPRRPAHFVNPWAVCPTLMNSIVHGPASNPWVVTLIRDVAFDAVSISSGYYELLRNLSGCRSSLITWDECPRQLWSRAAAVLQLVELAYTPVAGSKCPRCGAHLAAGRRFGRDTPFAQA